MSLRHVSRLPKRILNYTSTTYITLPRSTMRPDIAIPYRPSAVVRANLHSPPASPHAGNLSPEAVAHVVTDLQDPDTKQGRKDTLLALLGYVREADDPAERSKPVTKTKAQQGQLEVAVESEEGEVEGDVAESRDAEQAEEHSKRTTYTITGETGRPCPRERLMG